MLAASEGKLNIRRTTDINKNDVQLKPVKVLWPNSCLISWDKHFFLQIKNYIYFSYIQHVQEKRNLFGNTMLTL